MDSSPFLPVVAIVGRPNVGKSALFNRLIQRRQALVDATPGLTRDRLYGDVHWQGVRFRVVDTGGLRFVRGDRLQRAMEAQVAKAMEEATLALLVCDQKEGLMPLDREVVSWARRWGKPMLLVANKVDTKQDSLGIHDFSALGIGDPMAISALHGLRVNELLDTIVKRLGTSLKGTPYEPTIEPRVSPLKTSPIRVAIIGRPNVGKSSFVNRVLNEERVLVDESPGTTRDPVDTLVMIGDRKVLLIDTAGIRAKRRLTSRVDLVARIKALQAVQRSDVCLALLDGATGIVQDDLKLLDRVITFAKPVVLAVNKQDLLPKGIGLKEITLKIAQRAPFLRFFPVVLVSAKTGLNILEALEQARKLALSSTRRMTREEAEKLLSLMTKDPRAPARVRSSHFIHLSQVEVAPPTFHLKAKVKRPLKKADLAYVEALFRRELKMDGIPIRIHLLR